MKIQFTLAYNGHVKGMNGLEQYMEKRPGTDKTLLFGEWIEQRFGAWIKANLTEDYTLTNLESQDKGSGSFVVDFLHDTDAVEFQTKIGGRLLEE